MNDAVNHNHWSEQDSLAFIDLGRYFVPERELQIDIICSLLPRHTGPLQVVELCCGEGLLAEAILQRFPNATLLGLDGSSEMLQATDRRLAPYSGRYRLEQFDLADADWRQSPRCDAIVSSLAIHHLNDEQKRRLYSDLSAMLLPGGRLIVADIIQPACALGLDAAARLWDELVRQRALTIDGDAEAFEFFSRERWNIFHHPDPMDTPSRLFDQLKWLEQAGLHEIDVYWMKAGHAVFGGSKPARQG